VGAQPVGQRPGVAPFEKVQWGAGLDVDDQRAVVLPRRIAKSSTPVTRGDAAASSIHSGP
jgi:hypothetical protein